MPLKFRSVIRKRTVEENILNSPGMLLIIPIQFSLTLPKYFPKIDFLFRILFEYSYFSWNFSCSLFGTIYRMSLYFLEFICNSPHWSSRIILGTTLEYSLLYHLWSNQSLCHIIMLLYIIFSVQYVHANVFLRDFILFYRCWFHVGWLQYF